MKTKSQLHALAIMAKKSFYPREGKAKLGWAKQITLRIKLHQKSPQSGKTDQGLTYLLLAARHFFSKCAVLQRLSVSLDCECLLARNENQVSTSCSGHHGQKELLSHPQCIVLGGCGLGQTSHKCIGELCSINLGMRS